MDSGVWMLQDSNGCVWKVDLSFQLNSFEPHRLLSCHAGPVNACIHSPFTFLLVTAGDDCEEGWKKGEELFGGCFM